MPNPSAPEADKSKTRQLDLALVVLLILVVGGVVFQLFLRYTYVHTVGNTVVRVDRVSGDSCALPCDDGGYGPRTVPYVPAPTAIPAKVCHPANVVRVARTLQPPVTRTPTPYKAGGAPTPPPLLRAPRAHHHPHQAAGARAARYAVELSDGHVYTFSRDVFAADVTAWTTGQDVEVCATWSKLENRPYYSVGAADDAEPATLAI
jgi:hypothetical protein